MTVAAFPPDSPSLAASPLFDIDHPEIRSGVAGALRDGAEVDVAKAVAFYYAVRDGVSYQVFGTGLRDEDLTGSAIMRSKRGFCLHKAILFTTMCRAGGIPCRMSAARVTNHVSSPNLAKLGGGDVFLRCFNEVWLEDGGAGFQSAALPDSPNSAACIRWHWGRFRTGGGMWPARR